MITENRLFWCCVQHVVIRIYFFVRFWSHSSSSWVSADSNIGQPIEFETILALEFDKKPSAAKQHFQIIKPTEANYFNKALKALIVLIQKTACLIHSSELNETSNTQIFTKKSTFISTAQLVQIKLLNNILTIRPLLENTCKDDFCEDAGTFSKDDHLPQVIYKPNLKTFSLSLRRCFHCGRECRDG